MDKRSEFIKSIKAKRARAKNAGLSLPEAQIVWLKTISIKSGVRPSEFVQAVLDEKRVELEASN